MIKKFFPEREFAAFLFDFDGTIADTMGVHRIAWNKALGVYGLSLSLEQHLKWAGRPTREIVKLLGELHNVELSYEEISKNKEMHYMKDLPAVKGIIPVVDIIKVSRGQIPMAIVSGSRRVPVETTLGYLGLKDYFDVLVCAEDYVNGKPAPDCFLKAAALLNVNPKDCLVFEDAVLGIQAAHAAGMPCLRVNELPEAAGHELAIAHSKE
jgi:beta-phosphoglucomutase-like phosphatase (HAD superfamily)